MHSHIGALVQTFEWNLLERGNLESSLRPLIHPFIHSVSQSFTHSFAHSIIHSFIQTFEWNNLVRGNLVRVSFPSSPLSLSISLSFLVSFGLSLSLSLSLSLCLSYWLSLFYSRSFLCLFPFSLTLSLGFTEGAWKKTSGLDVVLKKEAKHDRARHRLLFVPGVLRLIDFVRLREEHCQTWWTTGWWR